MAGAIKRKWKFMLLGALVGAGVGFSAALVFAPRYRAQCLLEPRGGADGDALALKLLRPSLLKTVSETLAEDKTFYGSTLDVRSSLSAKKVAAGLIRLRCTGPEPMICERVLEIVLDGYRKSLLERSAREDEEEVRLIRDQIAAYRKAAGAEQEELNRFLQEYSWLAASGESEEGTIATYEEKERVHLENTRKADKLAEEAAAAREKRDKLKARLQGEKQHVVVEMVKELNPDVINLNEELLAKQKELRQFLVDSSEEHPTVKRLRKEIAATQKMIDEKPKEIIKEQKVSLNPIYSQLTEELFKAETDVKSTENRLASLQKEMSLYEKGRREIPPAELKKISALEKERRKNLEMVESLKSRLATILGREKDRDEIVVEFSVIDPPVSEEALPERWAMVAVGAVIGLLVGALLPFPGARTAK